MKRKKEKSKDSKIEFIRYLERELKATQKRMYAARQIINMEIRYLDKTLHNIELFLEGR